MKRMYGTPKAEKVEFNYSDVVVASSTESCDNTTPMTEHNTTPLDSCTTRPKEYATNGCTKFEEGF